MPQYPHLCSGWGYYLKGSRENHSIMDVKLHTCASIRAMGEAPLSMRTEWGIIVGAPGFGSAQTVCVCLPRAAEFPLGAAGPSLP